MYGNGSPFKIEGDVVSKNGIEYKKWELCQNGSNKINSGTEPKQEFKEKFSNTMERIANMK